MSAQIVVLTAADLDAPTEPPIVKAHIYNGQSIIRCAYCTKLHLHGLGDGHRVQHCDKPGHGYDLVTSPDPIPPEWIRELRRRFGSPRSRCR